MPKAPATYSLILPPSGGFRKLKSFQLAQLVYDITVRFVVRYIREDSRTRDQMEQAARSGAQNIAEGSMFSATSKKIEMNLTNVARSSLTELKLDYEDLLRQRNMALWADDDPRRTELVGRRFQTVDQVAHWIKEVYEREQKGPCTPADRDRAWAELSANAAHVLTGVAIVLLNRQLNSQAKTFEQEGGFSERLYRVRSEIRRNNIPPGTGQIPR
ncbi:MAG: four helix bundle suffix domain-containing protein [Flavobacteriales bacterium]